MEQDISGISKFPEKRGQPREVNRNFRNEFPENFCSIRFWTGISGNFGRMERALWLWWCLHIVSSSSNIWNSKYSPKIRNILYFVQFRNVLNFTEINDGCMFSVMSLFFSKTSYRKRLKDTYYCYLWCMHSKRISSFSLRRIMECQAVFCLSYKRFDLFQIVSVSECCVREDKSQLWISHSLKGNWKTKNNANTKKSSQPFMNISKTRIKTDWYILFSSQGFN